MNMANPRPKMPELTQRVLWAKAAGRCEFSGCNKILYHTSTTKESVNISDVAHIYAFSARGPRGSANKSELLAKYLSNLMLLCDECHTLIDRNQETYTVDILQRMKEDHERRIEITTGIDADKQSEILLYGANIGKHSSPVSYQKSACAMLPNWYPASTDPITLSMINSSFCDHEDDFWKTEEKNVRRLFNERVKPRLANGSVNHLSIFTLAPQPLLMLLGFLISDIPAAEVYQLHREPSDWSWQDNINGDDYLIREPSKINGKPALVLSLSASITSDRIINVLGGNPDIWTVTIPKPNNDFLKSQNQLKRFREIMRPFMDRIKKCYGENTMLNVFPAVPVAIAVEFGRLIMPKADLKLRIYDQNKRGGGFIHAIDINTEG